MCHVCKLPSIQTCSVSEFWRMDSTYKQNMNESLPNYLISCGVSVWAFGCVHVHVTCCHALQNMQDWWRKTDAVYTWIPGFERPIHVYISVIYHLSLYFSSSNLYISTFPFCSTGLLHKYMWYLVFSHLLLVRQCSSSNKSCPQLYTEDSSQP